MFQSLSKSIISTTTNIKRFFLIQVRYPDEWIGNDLYNKNKQIYEYFKNLFLQYIYLDINCRYHIITQMNDLLLQIIHNNNNPSNEKILYLSILEEIFKYIRVKLLDTSNPMIIMNIIRLLDYLIKNCHNYHIYFFIGQRIFMKTISFIARKFSIQKTSSIHLQVAEFIFDTIQGKIYL